MPRPRPLHVADNPGDQAGLVRAADIPGVRCQTSSLLGHDSERSRCEELLDTGRRKIIKGDRAPMSLTAIDELAYFSATVGAKAERDKFTATLRDCAARGRKALDTDTETLVVRAGVVELKNGALVTGPPKSEASNRVLTIPDFLVADVAEHHWCWPYCSGLHWPEGSTAPA